MNKNKNPKEYFELARKIWLEEVPKDGQSLTIQGEMIRSIEKLRDEAQRNGNANRDSGHLIMLAFVAENLLNCNIFSDEERNEILKAINILKEKSPIAIDDVPYDFLTEKVVDWYTESVGVKVRVVNPVLFR